ncbi:MAG: sigma 54-interacting transcriptional regulator [candidate division WOR-3 bacterium]
MDLTKFNLIKKGNFAKIYEKGEIVYKVGELLKKDLLYEQFKLLSEIRDPHFVTVYEWFEDGEKCGFSMEKISSPTIDKVFKVKPSQKEDFDKIKNILNSILDALSVLHSRGIVCGDLKPNHIFVDERNNVKLIDPGYNPEIITPTYTSPEAFTEVPSFSSDIYSIGIILYEILTGEKAFKGNLSKIIEEKLKNRLPPPERYNPLIPEELNFLIQRMIEPQIENRIKNIEDVKREILLGTTIEERKLSFITIFSGREKEIKDFEFYLSNLPEPHILLIKGEKGIGKTALLREFKIRALIKGINIKEMSSGEIHLFFKEERITEPIVIFIDNASLQEIKVILKENKTTIRLSPILIVISSPDKENELEELEDITTSFTLSPLNKEEIEFIINKNFPNKIINKKELTSFLLKQSEGNPLILNQLIENLILEGAIERKGDEIFFNEKLPLSISLPKGIEENLKAKLEKLPLEEKELLKKLSIFQESFPLNSISIFEIKNPYTLVNSLSSKNILKKDKKGIQFLSNWTRDFFYKKLTQKEKEELYKRIKKRISTPESLHLLEKDLGKEKEYRESLIKIAKKKIKEKDYQEAGKFLQEALLLKDEPILRMVLGRVFELGGKINEALSIYKELLEKKKENPFYLLKIGAIFDRLENKEEAEKYFREGIKFAKGKLKEEGIYWLGYFLVRQERIEEAEKLILEYKNEAKELPPKLKFVEGRFLCAKGDFEKTLKIVEEELKKDLSPTLKRHFLTLGGIANQQKEEHEEAIEYFEKCLEISKKERDFVNEAIFITYKGISLLRLDNYKEALKQLEEALSIFKKLKIGELESPCLTSLSILYLNTGFWEKLKEKIEDFKNRHGKLQPFLKAKLLEGELYKGNWLEVERLRNELKEEKYDLRDLEGTILRWKGELKEAEKIFREVLKRTKGDPRDERDIARQLSEVLFLEGKKEEAVETLKPYFEKISSLKSNFEKGKLLSSWGFINEEPRFCDKAIKLFSKISLPFHIAQTQLKKGTILLQKNRIEEAIEELKKAEEVFKELKSELFLNETTKLLAECARKTSLRKGYIYTYDEISKLLSSIDSEKRFDEALSTITEFLNAERGALILKENDKNIIVSSYNIDEITLQDARKISKTITEKVIKGEVIITGDATIDERFYKMDSIQRNKIRSILCVPITYKNKIYGVLYLDSTIKKDIFLPSDKEFLQSIGRILGILFAKGDLLYQIKEELARLRKMTSPPHSFHSIIGISEPMQKIYKTIEEIAPTDVNVLITGETGTGKELIARTIHSLSKRKNRPFVTVDCSSLTETLLQSELFGHKKGSFTGAIKDKKGMCEEANGGTLFLDEIGDAPPSIQAGLLRVTDLGEIRRVGETEIRKVDVRIISATNKDIEQMAFLREFREDLLYRLNQINISIPPLRERKIDIPILLEHYLKIFREKREKKIKGFTEEAIEILKNYPFPGNIRELRNIVEISIIKCKGEYIKEEDLPEEVKREKIEEKKVSWPEIKKKWERETILLALEETNWDIKKTAENLKISKRHLYRLIKEFEIKK